MLSSPTNGSRVRGVHPAARGNPPPPSLPPLPSPGLLTPEQMKRRHIVASLVHSENNYVATLQRLVNVSDSVS